MPHAQYLKGTEDRKTSVFLPDLPWYLPAGADGHLAELQAEAFHGTPCSIPPPDSLSSGYPNRPPFPDQLLAKPYFYNNFRIVPVSLDENEKVVCYNEH